MLIKISKIIAFPIILYPRPYRPRYWDPDWPKYNVLLFPNIPLLIDKYCSLNGPKYLSLFLFLFFFVYLFNYVFNLFN